MIFEVCILTIQGARGDEGLQGPIGLQGIQVEYLYILYTTM